MAKRNELGPEYKQEDLGPGVRGKYYEAYRRGTTLVLSSPEVAAAFPTEEAVNEALCSLIEFAQRSTTPTTPSARTLRNRGAGLRDRSAAIDYRIGPRDISTCGKGQIVEPIWHYAKKLDGQTLDTEGSHEPLPVIESSTSTETLCTNLNSRKISVPLTVLTASLVYIQFSEGPQIFAFDLNTYSLDGSAGRHAITSPAVGPAGTIHVALGSQGLGGYPEP